MRASDFALVIDHVRDQSFLFWPPARYPASTAVRQRSIILRPDAMVKRKKHTYLSAKRFGKKQSCMPKPSNKIYSHKIILHYELNVTENGII